MTMNQGYDFKDLFVFEMANNHQGSVEHGKRIISEVAALAKEFEIRAGIKFQFRQLDTFIHPDYRDATEPKHIPRFLSTELSREQFQALIDEVHKQGLLAVCTPFDEDSVDLIEVMDVDIVKVASCSVKDWPLLERISESGLPVIFSTGGTSIADIDNISSFAHHRGIDHAIMHCVALYPTPPELCQLNQIAALNERYPDTTIGWSTHEDPGDTDVVMLAYAKGARIFEKHVGVIAGDVEQLNAYSATPEQLSAWLQAYQKAKALCGAEKRPPNPQEELESLAALQRGVYAKAPIKQGQTIARDDVFFAMPYQDGQLSSGEWRQGIVANASFESKEAIYPDQVKIPADPDRLIIQNSLHEIKAMLNLAKVPLNSDFKVEYSHHYGIKNFRETGAVLIDLVNRDYCKKILVQLPGQRHPYHFHKLKDETFIVLHGVLHVEVDGHHRILSPGETCVVQPGVWHSFWTETGVIFEEISTTHRNDDSFYKDKKINHMPRSERKTVVDHWGRFELKHADEPEDPIWLSKQKNADEDTNEADLAQDTGEADQKKQAASA